MDATIAYLRSKSLEQHFSSLQTVSLSSWALFASSILVASLLVWVFIAWLTDRKRQKLIQNIPMPPNPYPLSHVVELLSGAPWDVMRGWMLKFGSVIRFHFLDTFIVVADPDIIKHIFSTRFENYLKDLKSTYKPFLDILGTGLITAHGDLWRKQRGLIATAFRMEILDHTAQISRQACDRLSVKLKAAKASGHPVEMAEEFRKLTLQVIGQAVLSLPPEVSDEVFPRLYLPIAMEGNERTWYPWRAYLPTPANFHYHRCVKELNSFVTKLVVNRWNARQEAKKKNPKDIYEGRMMDILDRIMDAVPEESWNDRVIKQLRDEIKTFLFAGHETSSMMLTWTLFELTQNPRCLQKVKEEAASVFKGGEMPAFEELRNLNYTLNSLKEALRKYSVVPVVTREVAQTETVGDYTFPAGAKIVVHMKAVHHREDLWDNPSEFRPERFDGKLAHPYAFIPFIEGFRQCIGQHFALLETKIVLAMLLSRFEFRPADGRQGESHPYEIPITPAHKMMMTIH